MALKVVILMIGMVFIDGKRVFDPEFDTKQNVGMTQKYFKQTVDHFNAYNTPTTFNQRWFYDNTYWNGADKNAPFLFQAGGEGQNNGYIYPFVTELAQEVGGLLLTAEHRFYGESRPFGNSNSYTNDASHLGLLQVEQAMADYMVLMTYLKNEYFNCSTCPVIVFGGSYPGELAVWLRMKYPHMFDIALGASAPIFYTAGNLVDPYAYYQIITNAAQKYGDSCVTAVKLGYQALISSTNKEITAGIPLCSELSDNINEGLYELYALLYEHWANLGMGNYPPATSPMKSVCQEIASLTDGLSIVSQILSDYRTTKGCVNLSQQVPAGKDGTIHCSDLTGCGTGYDGESWDYQACSQNIEPFATNNETDMFPVFPWNTTWLDSHCMSRFGIKATEREYWMEKEFGLTQPYFDKMKDITSYIIFSNGLQDGWSAGGVLTNLSDTLIAIPIPNGAHHSDMKGSSKDDTQDMIDARKQEMTLLKQWINDIQLKKHKK